MAHIAKATPAAVWAAVLALADALQAAGGVLDGDEATRLVLHMLPGVEDNFPGRNTFLDLEMPLGPVG
jgi:hypothetical protein